MILTIINGTSSLKVALFDAHSLARIIDLKVIGIGSAKPLLEVCDRTLDIVAETNEQALGQVFEHIFARSFEPTDITAVGHKIVRGGDTLNSPSLIDDKMEQALEAAAWLAPASKAIYLSTVRLARRVLSHCPHIAIFDSDDEVAIAKTVHSTLFDLNPTTPPLSRQLWREACD